MNIIWRSILVFCLLTALPVKVTTALAQEQTDQSKGEIVLNEPDSSAFPTIRFYLNAFNETGQFIESLKASDLQIKEDDQTITPQTVEPVPSGLQTIFVLNLGPALSNQVSGQSQYQRIQNALTDWGNSQSKQKATAANLDDYSLATPAGLYLIRAKTLDQFTQAVKEYQPDLAKLQPSLNSLAEALDLASDPTGGTTPMERAILYITPPAAPNSKTTLADLATRAKKTGVRVSVWMVGPVPTNEPAAAEPLRSLAKTTGGQFAEINTDPLPDIEPLFRPLRQIYQIAYQSTIHKAGAHNLTVQMSQGNLPVTSNQRTFTLDIQPPNPIFLSPPASIERSWSAAQKDANATLVPSQVPLQILIEFPDHYKRTLKATRLFVNEKLVDENTSEPFDRFDWPISELTTPARYMLRAEAIDAQGLSGSSAEIPIDLLVEQPARASLFDHISRQGIIAVSAMTLSGGVLVLILVLTNRNRLGRRSRNAKDKKRLTDPVTQPVPIKQEKSKSRKGRETAPAVAPGKIAWPVNWAKPNGQNAPARLVALDENEHPITGGSIPLSRQEITFGSDPRRATQLLESATVDGLHARLYRSPDGCFYLADQGSIAGTWVNFSPIPVTGAPLENGDLIHIGRMMFRFELIDSEQMASPITIKVIDLEKIP